MEDQERRKYFFYFNFFIHLDSTLNLLHNRDSQRLFNDVWGSIRST